MTRIHEGMENVPFETPEGIVKVAVCRKSGKLPTNGCRYDGRGSAIYEEYFDADNVPTETCDIHTSGGSIRLPEGEESKRTDDSSYASNYRSSGSGSSGRRQSSGSSSSSGGGSSSSAPVDNQASQGSGPQSTPQPVETAPAETAPAPTAAPQPEAPASGPGVIYQGGDSNSSPEVGPGAGL